MTKGVFRLRKTQKGERMAEEKKTLKLFEVEMKILVLAEDEGEAGVVASQYGPDVDDFEASEIRTVGMCMSDWLDSFPYREYDEETPDRTCKQWLEIFEAEDEAKKRTEQFEKDQGRLFASGPEKFIESLCRDSYLERLRKTDLSPPVFENPVSCPKCNHVDEDRNFATACKPEFSDESVMCPSCKEAFNVSELYTEDENALTLVSGLWAQYGIDLVEGLEEPDGTIASGQAYEAAQERFKELAVSHYRTDNDGEEPSPAFIRALNKFKG